MSTYPHDDDRCRQDSVDAECFRDATRQFARLATALGLHEGYATMGEIVDHVIAKDVHFTHVPGSIRCGAIIALDVPDASDTDRTGTVECDRCAGHIGPHRIGDVHWPNLNYPPGVRDE